MNSNEFSNTMDESNLTQLTQVGGVRAMRIRRDVGISTIPEVAQASIDSLMGVWSVGPVRARQIKGSAQGWMQKRRADRKALTRTPRVAVVVGQGAFDDLHKSFEPNAVISKALDKVGIDYESDVEIGYVADGMGGDEIGFWLDRKQYFNHDLLRCSFRTPWDKYKRFTDPIEFVSEDWKAKHGVWTSAELPKGRLPETVPLSQIPFVDQPEDVQLWMAPAERTNDMVNWADEVVIVLDGEHAEKFRTSAEYRKTECTTVFAEPRGLPELEPWTPEEDDENAFAPDEDEQVTGGRGMYDGADLEDDEVWHTEAFDSDEARMKNGLRNSLSHYDPGGKGAGKNENRWG